MDGVGESLGALTGLSFAAQGSATQESSRARPISSSQEDFVPAEKNQTLVAPADSDPKVSTNANTPGLSSAGDNAPSKKPVPENPQNANPDKKTAGAQSDNLNFQIDNTALQYRFVDTTPKTGNVPASSGSGATGAPPKTAHTKQLVVVVVDEESGKVVRQLPPAPPKYFKDDEFKKIKIGSHVDKRG